MKLQDINEKERDDALEYYMRKASKLESENRELKEQLGEQVELYEYDKPVQNYNMLNEASDGIKHSHHYYDKDRNR